MRTWVLFVVYSTVILLTLLTTLSGQMGHPIQINPVDEAVRFAGQNAFRHIGDTIHAVYLTDQWEIVYFRYHYPQGPFHHLTVESFGDYHNLVNDMGEISLPVLEILSDGTVYIFYSHYDYSEEDATGNLFRAEINPSGEFMGTEIIAQSVYSTVEIVNSGDNLHLLYKNGFEIPISAHHLFYDKYSATDNIAGNVRFSGIDEIPGRVHTNDDIWIRQTGGGPSNGFPTFYDLVTLTGEVRVFPGGGDLYPHDLVFRGGLIENYPALELPIGADEIRQNGIYHFGANQNDDRIYFVTIDGNTFTSMIGNIVHNDPQSFPYYDSYPPYGPIGNELGVSYIAIPDTIWTPGPSGNVVNSSVWVPGELWISGVVEGFQTWGSSHNIYIKDDITYMNTIPGDDSNLDYPFEDQDMLALVSEKSILIQYGHRDPTDSLRYKPNTNNITIHGHLFALGEDTGPNQYGIHIDSGVFTYQYQYPKGSTPAQYWNEDFYHNIDLHLRRYPTTPIDPWPVGLDYPWYNPLWPEPGPIFSPGAPYSTLIPNPHNTPTVTFLRGTLNLFGGVSSRRAFFVRRSGNATFDTGIWDIENGIFGRHPHQPSGYDKNYLNDRRFYYVQPPDVPASRLLDESDDFMLHYLRQEAGEDEFAHILSDELVRYNDVLLIDTFDDRIAMLTGNRLLLSDVSGSNFQVHILDISPDRVKEISFTAYGIFILERGRLLLYHPVVEELSIIDEVDFAEGTGTIAFDGTVLIWALSTDPESVEFRLYAPQTGEMIDSFLWEHGIVFPSELAWRFHSRLGLHADQGNLYIMIYEPWSSSESGLDIWAPALYFTKGYLEYQSVDYIDFYPDHSLRHYPNPVLRDPGSRSPTVNISFALQEGARTKLTIYNIKGQLVRQLENSDYPKGEHTLSWDGRDDNGRRVSRGVYLYKLETGNHQSVQKMLILN